MPARATSTSDNDAGDQNICPSLVMLLPSLRYHDIARTPLSLSLSHTPLPSINQVLTKCYQTRIDVTAVVL